MLLIARTQLMFLGLMRQRMMFTSALAAGALSILPARAAMVGGVVGHEGRQGV
jgi:hypothetical protein